MLGPPIQSNITSATTDALGSQGETTVVNLTKTASGVYEIPCKINGLELKFIFDTGASNVSISATEAIFMLKNGYLNKSDLGDDVQFSIANGDIAQGTLVNIRRLEFQGLILTDVAASIVHELEAPLLLGQSALSKLGKIEIDYKSNTLTFVTE